MSATTAQYRDGQIWWRGSNVAWIYRQHSEAVRLRDLFAKEARREPYARILAADLTTAIAEYETDHSMEKAA